METKEIQELLQAYVQHGSESAFRDLVKRYITLVYSTALRQLGGRAHLAEDVSQTVFTDFARKARTLPSDVLLGGWLHKHTCFVAANVSRSERRRTDRENQAAQMNTLTNDSDENWKQIAPVLDDAINELSAEDRDAVTLRYFEQRDFRSIGATLGVSDDTAQKRVSRALEKLRGLLVNHGVTLTATALGTLLTNQSLASLPSSLAENVAGAAFAKAGKSTSALKSLLTVKMGLALVALITLAIFTPSIVSKFSKIVSGKQTEANSSVAETVQSTEDNRAQANAEQPTQTSSNNSGRDAVAGNSDSLNQLTLKIISLDTQRPIPNATVDLRAQAGKWVTKKLTVDRSGVCEVEIPADLKTIELTTQIKGFADTRLSWNVERGAKIPAKYIVAVERAVLIGGRVLGPDGNPVEGAKVGFNHDDDPISKKLPESHEFSWIEVKTDSAGRWQIDRMASDMLPRLYGSAKHTNFVDSSLAMVSRKAGMEEQLRNREHIFQLGKGLTIYGSVVDADNLPVLGAKVFFGGRGMSGRRETKSLADGSFSLAGCKPGKEMLTAEAKGFATTTIEVDPATKSGPYQLQLHLGKTLRLLIVDKNGSPVPKASVWLDTMPIRNSNEPKTNPVQANFESKADGDGRLIWDSAPDGELRFFIHKSGYMSLRDLKLEANNEEQVVTLPPALVVSGTVKNENGQMIPRFKIICGWPSKYFEPITLKENWNPSWSTFERDWLTFVGGNYRHSFGEPLIFGMQNPGYLLKFEAEGYTSFTSRLIAPDEGEIQIDVVLHRAVTPIVSVSLPNGAPAIRADVGLVSPGSRLNFIPGGFSRENRLNGTSLLSTDVKGHFRLPSDESISRVIIAHPGGYADVTLAMLAAKPNVSLQSWGALEGTYLSGGKPLVGRELTLGLENAGHDDLSYDFQSRVKTDAHGHFIFPKLLPGKHKLIGLIHQQISAKSGSFQHAPLQDVEIRSGETTTVNIGESGYEIIARFRFPPGASRQPGMRFFASVHVPYPVLPAEIRSDLEALKKWQENPEIKRLAQMPNYPFRENADGTWATENVPAGDYEITVMAAVFEKSESGKPVDSWHGRMNITVPKTPATGTIDAGEIELTLAPAK